MRTLHFDCFSGISGDMTLAALIDAGVDPAELQSLYASFGLPIKLEVERIRRNGFAAVNAIIDAPEQEQHRYLPEVEAILNASSLNNAARTLAIAIFHRLAVAEAAAHGMPIEKVHFHEVGALDSIADIAGVAYCIDRLAVKRVTCRSVPPGSGSVKCAHGIMPVPTPATALLLQGVPLAKAPVAGELVTPTGAAILATMVNEYCEQPCMTIERIGVGSGKKDFWEQPNVLRVFLGESSAEPAASSNDTVVELATNLDHISAEWIGHAVDELFAGGALDVFSCSIQMKKGRPGTLLTVLAPPDRADALEAILFRETGTLGVRRSSQNRTIAAREIRTLDTPFGPVRVKFASMGGLSWANPEYDDCVRIAREHELPLPEVYATVRRAVDAIMLHREKK